MAKHEGVEQVENTRQGRKPSTHIDGIHVGQDGNDLGPAQLYSTESGRLFHSGRITICLVGLPARGKTHLSVALARYLRWLGVKTKVFHLGDYRRTHMMPGKTVPDDYFHVDASPSSMKLRREILQKCLDDIESFLRHENGQVAIFDAVNPLSAGRRSLVADFTRYGAHTLFLESSCDDQRIIEDNVRQVKISSPDYAGWREDEAVRHYLARIDAKIPYFESMTEDDLSFIKMINAGERIVLNNCNFSYLSHRIVFYLSNIHVKTQCTYFISYGSSGDHKTDTGLSIDEAEYAAHICQVLIDHRQAHGKSQRLTQTSASLPSRPLTVWTSTRRKSLDFAHFLADRQFKVRQRSLLSEINLGVWENQNPERLLSELPDELSKHRLDPYHHRYPRGESYHDLAVRLEPVILELEREQDDLLIVAHESVLKVLYGYLMACNANDIPSLAFPKDEIIEIRPASYNNVASRIKVPLQQSQIPP